ncbi:MAG: aminotransferase class I/II-fold pyridoxal phosphate-dependent enzyme [Eggerthellaceae bacterium]|nr:aminotransferase class I/II-fold pyridoxal phosphate-dependent enzyme [Eggerthellaceae bacterium]
MPRDLNTQLDILKPSGIRAFSQLASKTPGCVSLALGEPGDNTDFDISQMVRYSLLQGFTHYPPNNGHRFLRKAIAKHLTSRKTPFSTDEIIVTSGATEALYVALTTILNPEDEVIIPTPAFSLYESIIILNRANPVFLDTSKTFFQITREQLEERVSPRTKAIIITSPNNPTGCMLNEESLAAVAEYAQKNDFYVICDDVYGQLVFDGVKEKPYFAAQYPNLREQTICIDSFSKPYSMTGWRLGWLAADKPFIDQASKVHQYAVSSVTSFTQHAAAYALRYEPDERRMRYQRRRDKVMRAVAASGKISCAVPQGAFYAFLDISELGMGSEEFCERAIREAGVALVPGVFFRAEGFVRLSFAADDEILSEGLKRLIHFVDSL